jgi:DNA-binding winged helix-turn-helix (wHTH) protein
MPKTIYAYRFGPFQLDAAEHRLLRNGVEVCLQLKAFEILCGLVEKAGCLLRKEDLLRQVWPDTVVEENNLNKNISLLRKALGEPATGHSDIETVPRVGYRFVAAVTPVAPHASPPTNDQGADASTVDTCR